ncbi:MAG TPA: hypothetical protein VGQ58_11435 [Candidatus Limnocylindrales bacterium]|nr:hypothetical protein [Candidatus Limnocylindrales bacterium]
MSRRRVLPLLGAVVALAVVAIALAPRVGDERVETGVVVAVDSAGLTDVRGFTLRTADGRTLDFRIGRVQNPVQFPPAHLGVHLADGVPVRVTFEMEGDERVAIRLEDAPR